MSHTEKPVTKPIVTDRGEDCFQVRYLRDEDVGLLTTPSGDSYLILDSLDYWYDVTQDSYPTKQKCTCKNDWFGVSFDYMPRPGTQDYKAVEITTCCTQCGKTKNLSTVKLDFSPTAHLLEKPITFCPQPKIKYKTYDIGGYWDSSAFQSLISFLFEKGLSLYALYWTAERQRCLGSFSQEEFREFLLSGNQYIALYFSPEPIHSLVCTEAADGKGPYLPVNIWRNHTVIKINAPFAVLGEGTRYFHSMQFCSEYLEKGTVTAKDVAFCQTVAQLLKFCKTQRLK